MRPLSAGVLRDAAGLSSGTMATLLVEAGVKPFARGAYTYEQVDDEQGRFVVWLAGHDHFATWQDAWRAWISLGRYEA